MSAQLDPTFDTGRVEKLIKGAKNDPVAFAFGLGQTPDKSVMAVDKSKAGKALFELCRKVGGAKKGAFGSARLQGATAVFFCEKDDTSNLEKAVLAYFKAQKIGLKVQVQCDAVDGGHEEPADKPGIPGLKGKDEPSEGSEEEDVPEGKVFDPDVIVPLIRKAKNKARAFAFGVGPDLGILAVHPKMEPIRLAKKVREEGAKKGVWGTVLLDGSVAVFTCEKEPFSGVKKGIRKWLTTQKLTLKFRVLGPDGEYEDPEDDATGTETAGDQNRTTDDGQSPVDGAIERMRAHLENARPRLHAAARSAPSLQPDIDRALAAFEIAAREGNAAAAKDALNALATLAKAPADPDIDVMRVQLERARPRLLEQFKEAGRIDEFDREVTGFETAAAAGDTKSARAAFDRLSAAARGLAGHSARGGLVALQKSRLVWDGLRTNLQAQLQELERSILDAVRAHNADENAADYFDEAAVAAGVRKLHRILDGLDNRLIDKLDEALEADAQTRRSLHAEAAEIVTEYKDFVDGDPLFVDIDDNGFLATTIRVDAQAALTDLAQQLQPDLSQ